MEPTVEIINPKEEHEAIENRSIENTEKEKIDDIDKLTARLSTSLKSVYVFFLTEEENLTTQLTSKLSFIKRTFTYLQEDFEPIVKNLNKNEISELGGIQFRCLRSCHRILSIRNKNKNKNIRQISEQDKKRIAIELDIIESTSFEIVSFLDTKNTDNTEKLEISKIFHELRLAKEMYSQLIERVDDIRGTAQEAILAAEDEALSARDTAIAHSNTIKELVSKSTNAYLAADFSERKNGNTWELVFWLSIMTILLTIDAWLILKFDFAAKDVWQNRLIDLGLIGFVATVAFWMGRNFRAAMHQRTILDQRIATLKTFQAFYEKVENPSLKDAIVFEASRTIFSHASSGYAIDSQQNEMPTFADIARFASATKS